MGIVPEPIAVAIPGEVTGLGVRCGSWAASMRSSMEVILRTPKAGDRVRLRHSRGAKPLKEIFERMNVGGEARTTWPVLEWQGRIVWMKGVEVEPEAGDSFSVEQVRGEPASGNRRFGGHS